MEQGRNVVLIVSTIVIILINVFVVVLISVFQRRKKQTITGKRRGQEKN